jgi:hypothetical protein
VSPGGLSGQKYQRTGRSTNRNCFFFTMRGIGFVPRMVHVVDRRRPIFFADNHLGREARLTSVGIEGKTPHWQGMGLTIRPVDIRHNVQSERRKLRPCSNPRRLSGAVFIPSGVYYHSVFFSGRFVRESPFSGAIFRATSLLGDNIRHHFRVETRFRRDFAPRLKIACRSDPLSCRPSSVEMPVCGVIRRTPCPVPRAPCNLRRGGLTCLQEMT